MTFIHPYLNYDNIVWASTNKSKLNMLLRKQKHADKDKFTHAKPLLRAMKALNIYQ